MLANPKIEFESNKKSMLIKIWISGINKIPSESWVIILSTERKGKISNNMN
jgi:hypothetical protein